MKSFINSVRNGNFYGTTGPFMELKLDESYMGEMHSGNQGTLNGRIYSVDWAKANNLKIQMNGKQILDLKLNDSGIFSIPLEFNQDSFITIETSGKAGENYQAVYPGFFPYAFSNPIYIDADGDGVWTPPGLESN